jgi:murein L,D-transpeptidase YafK
MKLLVAAVPAVLLAAVASFSSPGQAVTDQKTPQPNARASASGANAQALPAPLKLPLVNPKIVVSKSARRLELYSGGRVVRVYRVVLGGDAVNDKEREGDLRTPEGDFRVVVKNEKSQFHLSLGLSYPNREDAERGLRAGLITRADYDRIVGAIRRGRTPPWDTPLGGEIYIHGGGTSSDWTAGCVALDNSDIQELFDAVPVGTPVRIEP